MDELNVELRKFKLDDLLLLLAEKSRQLYKDSKFLEKYVFERKIGRIKQQSKELILPVWGLSNIAHRAILNSNDYRKQVPTSDNILWFNNLLTKVSDDEAKIMSGGKNFQELKTDLLQGLSQTQFWWQELTHKGRTVYNFLRYYILLNEMPNFFPQYTHPNKELQQITNFGIKDFSKLLFAIYTLLITNSPEMTDVKKIKIDAQLVSKNPILTPENMFRCLKHFIADYNYYRKQDYPSNPLFFKPVISTDSGRVIISDTFIWGRKFFEGIYWILRDEYKRKNSTLFTTAFGDYYEKYVEKVLDHYLDKINFRKINEGGKADWIIFTDKYVLIIEQKSCLMAIAAKTEYPSEKALAVYLENLRKACHQLNNTISILRGDKRKIIKIILHFEKIYFKEVLIKEKLTEQCKGEFESLKRYYMVDTDEFELLIDTMSKDINMFYNILEKKIEYEDNPPPPVVGQDFRHVINVFIKDKKIDFLEKYRPIFDNLIELPAKQ